MKAKRILSLVLAVVLCAGLLPMTALAASDFAIENSVLTKYTGPGGDVVIPDGVTEIGDQAFRGCLSLTSVTMPDSVTSIGDLAFVSCEKLTSITIPDSVSAIGEGAFARCEDLTSVIIPAGVTTISKTAFSSCHSLTSVTIPESVTTIGYAAFRHCSRLTSVVIPDSVTEISDYAFDACDSLTDVYYGGSEERWKEVEIGDKEDGNVLLQNAAIHYNSKGPTPQPTAQPSTQSVNVDGKSVEFAMYALLDDGGNQTNYIRVRDLAALLNGTAAQFEVGWNGHVALTAKAPYTGTADKAPFSTEMPYTVYTEPTYVNGTPVDLDAIQIQYNGGGYTYYKLRDLGQALGFNVGWSADKGIFVETETEQTDEAQQTEPCEVGKQYESANGYGVTINKAEITKVKGVRTLAFEYTLENLTGDKYLSEKTFTFGFADGTISNQGGIYLDGMYPGEKLTKTFNLIVEDKELSYIMFDDTEEEESPQERLARLAGKMPEKAFTTHLVWYFDK